MRRITCLAAAGSLILCTPSADRDARRSSREFAHQSATPIIDWSNEARRAIVPPGPDGIFGLENYGNKFPGEAAVYMGIVHAAIYDTALAIAGGYSPYAIALTAPADTSPASAIATVVHHVLVGLQPHLGLTATQQAVLDGRYAAYLAKLPDDPARKNGIDIGEQVSAAVLARRAEDGREHAPRLEDLDPPPPGAGVWDPGLVPAVGLRLPGIRPLALESGSQFRPDGPNPLAHADYADDFRDVKDLGRADSRARTAAQTTAALFWTDHDLRQWNDGLLRLAVDRDLDLLQTARMLAMAHVAGADAMIACFDAKYEYWFWRPYQAIPRADSDRNPATEADPAWRPLRTTPNFPEYPSAHACHSTAVAETLSAFFGTDGVPLSLDSRITGTIRSYARFHEVVLDVDRARVLVGFHFRNSDQEGSNLGRAVARYVVARLFLPTTAAVPRTLERTGRGATRSSTKWIVQRQ